MQYSSPLISSKLWVELATYVRQLCKISDRAHVQNLTGRERQDNDRKKGLVVGGCTWLTGTMSLEGLRKNNKRHAVWGGSRVSCSKPPERGPMGYIFADPFKPVAVMQTLFSLIPPPLTARDLWGLLKVTSGEQCRETDCCCRRTRTSTTCPLINRYNTR